MILPIALALAAMQAVAPQADSFPDAYLDPGARALVAQARERRDLVEGRIERYRTVSRSRISIGLRALRRDRMFYRCEAVARVEWNRRDTIRVDLLAAREVIPIVTGEPKAGDGDCGGDPLVLAFTLGAFPVVLSVSDGTAIGQASFPESRTSANNCTSVVASEIGLRTQPATTYTAGPDGAMWFVELAGQMDGRAVDGNRVGRITMDGEVTEYPIPSQTGSPINIAVGPDRQIWYTKGSLVGRVTPDGTITEFPMPATAPGATGLTAGSDRQPPTRLSNRLWVAASAGNRLAYLEFR